MKLHIALILIVCIAVNGTVFALENNSAIVTSVPSAITTESVQMGEISDEAEGGETQNENDTPASPSDNLTEEPSDGGTLDTPDETELPDCSTAEEFRKLLVQNEGGEITLTCDIVWDSYYMEITIEKPTTVIMGDFGIHIPKNKYLYISGPIHFEGNGTIKPLFLWKDIWMQYG